MSKFIEVYMIPDAQLSESDDSKLTTYENLRCINIDSISRIQPGEGNRAKLVLSDRDCSYHTIGSYEDIKIRLSDLTTIKELNM